MSRREVVECDRCGETATVDEAEGWADMVFGVGSGELRADLCPPCFEGLQRYLDGDDAVRLIDVPFEREPEIIELTGVTSREQALRLARRDQEQFAESAKTLREKTIIEHWHKGTTTRAIGELIGTSAGRVSQLAHALGLPPRQRGRARRTAPRIHPSGGSQRRHVTPTSGWSVSLPDDHRAVTGARTLFPSTVVDVADSPRVLIDGVNQRKIGRKVMKGAWKGMPLYTLTLEERATCPRSCAVWADCYGNNMHLARRHRHGPELEARLRHELQAAQERHPGGFVVRLHILGDFYSVPYVLLWSEALKRLPALHVFGFTARGIETPIGEAVLKLNLEHVRRCRIRYSDAIEAGGMGAVVIDDPAEAGKAVVCPAQTEKTDCCATCALCWTMNRPVAFLRHGEAVAAALD